MKRRSFLLASALGALAPWRSFAQARRVRIGVLGPVPLQRSVWGQPLVRSLAELGYRQGERMMLEYRSSEGIADRYFEQARELTDLKCDLIFALGTEPAVRALKAQSAIPVVFLAVDYDPLERQVVGSLSRPEGNVTGVYVPQGALVAKRLEIMREIVPGARRFLVFTDLFSKDQVPPAQAAAEKAGVQLTLIDFADPPYDLAAAFAAGRKAQVEGFIGLASPVFAARRGEISALLAEHRVPSIGSALVQASSGYLLSLGADVDKTTRRAAEIGLRILNGTKPAEIPVEQADEFELAVNASTARALGVKIPESVLARATRIIA